MLIIRPYQESDAQSISMSVCPFAQHDNPAVLVGPCGLLKREGILFLLKADTRYVILYPKD